MNVGNMKTLSNFENFTFIFLRNIVLFSILTQYESRISGNSYVTCNTIMK